MRRKLIYHTYLLKLWLSAMFVAPILFLVIAFIVNSSAFTNILDGPLKFAVAVIFFMIFLVPTFLFFVVLSVITPKLTEEPKKLKIITIIVSVLATITIFLSFYDSEWYNKTQFAWGLLLALIYCGCITFFGTRYKVSQ